MPLFEVTEYFTYADRFSVLADTAEDARAKGHAWYAAHCPMPEPTLVFDADGEPEVALYSKNDFVDAAGYRVCDEDGETLIED